jgi:hypothetical protein
MTHPDMQRRFKKSEAGVRKVKQMRKQQYRRRDE